MVFVSNHNRGTIVEKIVVTQKLYPHLLKTLSSMLLSPAPIKALLMSFGILLGATPLLALLVAIMVTVVGSYCAAVIAERKEWSSQES